MYLLGLVSGAEQKNSRQKEAERKAPTCPMQTAHAPAAPASGLAALRQSRTCP